MQRQRKPEILFSCKFKQREELDSSNPDREHRFCKDMERLGPHHFIGGESFSVGPDTFSGVGGWTEPEELQGKDIWSDSYCFVELGF